MYTSHLDRAQFYSFKAELSDPRMSEDYASLMNDAHKIVRK